MVVVVGGLSFGTDSRACARACFSLLAVSSLSLSGLSLIPGLWSATGVLARTVVLYIGQN